MISSSALLIILMWLGQKSHYQTSSPPMGTTTPNGLYNFRLDLFGSFFRNLIDGGSKTEPLYYRNPDEHGFDLGRERESLDVLDFFRNCLRF